MNLITRHGIQFANDGFAIIDDVYSPEEVDAMAAAIEGLSQPNADKNSTGLFAIRRLLIGLPGLKQLIFSDALRSIIDETFGDGYFLVKSIYFDKPDHFNWFVAWHQDLTINIKDKREVDGFGKWTKKSDEVAVRPPIEILRDNFTIRVHLDDTDATNGALKVIPGAAHIIHRPESIQTGKSPIICSVKSGGVMLMSPLLLHSSNRTTSGRRRRVIHLEFSKANLPGGLIWSEKEEF
jgi:hypothetical protein